MFSIGISLISKFDTIVFATSRGGFFADLDNTIAILVAKSPCSFSRGISTVNTGSSIIGSIFESIAFCTLVLSASIIPLRDNSIMLFT